MILGAELAYKKALVLDDESERSIVGLGVIERMKGNYAKASIRQNARMADRSAKRNFPGIFSL